MPPQTREYWRRRGAEPLAGYLAVVGEMKLPRSSHSHFLSLLLVEEEEKKRESRGAHRLWEERERKRSSVSSPFMGVFSLFAGLLSAGRTSFSLSSRALRPREKKRKDVPLPSNQGRESPQSIGRIGGRRG
jgi:hypothetical protein